MNIIKEKHEETKPKLMQKLFKFEIRKTKPIAKKVFTNKFEGQF